MAKAGAEIVKVLVDRDGYDRDEAEERVEEFIEDVREAVDSGDSLFAVEQMVRDAFGLEPDYADWLLAQILPPADM